MWLKFSCEHCMISGCSFTFPFARGDWIRQRFDFRLSSFSLSSAFSSLSSISIREKLRLFSCLLARLDDLRRASAIFLLSSCMVFWKRASLWWKCSRCASKAMIWVWLKRLREKMSLQRRLAFSRSLLHMSSMTCCRARSIVLYSPCTSRSATFCFARRARSCAFSYSHTGDRSYRPTELTFAFSADTFGFSTLVGAGAGFFSVAGCAFLKEYWLWVRSQSPFSREWTMRVSLSTWRLSLLLEQAMTRVMMSSRLMLSFWLRMATRAALSLRWRSRSSSSRDLHLSKEDWQVSSRRTPTRPISLMISSKETTAASYLALSWACWASTAWRVASAALICWWWRSISSLMKGSSSCRRCWAVRRWLQERRWKCRSSMVLMSLKMAVQSLLRCDSSSPTSPRYIQQLYYPSAHHPPYYTHPGQMQQCGCKLIRWVQGGG